MTRPRSQLVSATLTQSDTPYYHVMARCVPKALRGVGSTQYTTQQRSVGQALPSTLRNSAPWGRLYTAPTSVELTHAPGKTTNTDAHG